MSDTHQSISRRSVVYCCPVCKGEIDEGKDRWRCKLCGREFEVRRGVPVLNVGSEPASGFLEATNPAEFLDSVERKGWRRALEDFLGPDSIGLLRTTSPNRVAWKYLFDIGSSWKVLDIGGGSGGVACQLARECSVVALDKSWCDAAFMHLRAQQQGSLQLEVVSADAVSLPFASSQFDLVDMVGVLEWVPTGWPDKEPRQTQLQALREAFRVLKPGGSLFLAIENRHYLAYFLGMPEQHTNMKYVTLLQREEAEVLSQDIRGRRYLELTHSEDELKELLREVGFEQVQAFWLYPDYLWNNYVIPLDQPNIIKWFVEEALDARDFRGVESPLYHLYRFLDPGLVRRYVGCFGFVACRPDGSRQ